MKKAGKDKKTKAWIETELSFETIMDLRAVTHLRKNRGLIRDRMLDKERVATKLMKRIKSPPFRTFNRELSTIKMLALIWKSLAAILKSLAAILKLLAAILKSVRRSNNPDLYKLRLSKHLLSSIWSALFKRFKSHKTTYILTFQRN